MSYRIEFPDFDYLLPELPGFTDESLRSDHCPVLRLGGDGYRLALWCDYADVAKREWVDGKRYTVSFDVDGAHSDKGADTLIEAVALIVNCIIDLYRFDRETDREPACPLPVALLDHLLAMKLAEGSMFGKASHDDVVREAAEIARCYWLTVSVDPKTFATRTWQ
jgi:hypothetical protein